jgi:hypothetical protein
MTLSIAPRRKENVRGPLLRISYTCIKHLKRSRSSIGNDITGNDERNDHMLKRFQKGIVAIAVLGAIAVGASAIAGAASNSGAPGQQGPPGQQGAPGQQGSTGPPPGVPGGGRGPGPGETLLTDGNATKVKQAALDKVPGATVIRVETDAQGSPYEAHLRKSNGTEVTVKVNDQFKATDVQSGFGGPPPGSHP